MQQLWESGHHMYLLCLPLWPSRSCSIAEGICAITYNIVIGTLLECINLNICAQPNTSEPLNISTSFNISNHLIYLHHDNKADVDISINIFLVPMYKAYTGWFFWLVPPQKVWDYIVNPIKKVLSVRIYLPKNLWFLGGHQLKKTPCMCTTQ